MVTQHLFNLSSMRPEEQSRYQQHLAALPKAHAALKQRYDNQSLPLLQLPHRLDDLDGIAQAAETIKASAKALVVCGTGGSSLGGQALVALSDAAFPITFMDNVDPHTMGRFLNHASIADTHFLFISKSGGTAETLSQALLLLSAIETVNGAEAIARQCHAIVEPGSSALRQLAERYHIPVLDHDPGVGGRFSVLSCVGLLPAAVGGLDIASIRKGAAKALDQALDNTKAPPLLGAAWQCALMKTRPVSIWMPYCDRLQVFGAWVQQLWAESLGKSGYGSTPVRAVGAVDQHSQLQLYLDGPQDKSFNLISPPSCSQGAVINTRGIPALDYLEGKRIADVMEALHHGTRETLSRHLLPLRSFELTQLDEMSMGWLMMHAMIETIMSAQLLEIDAFDQPAVEEGKQLARDFLRATQ